MAILLIHELAHTFRLHDNYDKLEHSAEGYQCVMEKYITNLNENRYAETYYASIKANGNAAFCSSCKSALEALMPYPT